MAMGVAAVVSFDVIGQIAAGGGQAVTWIAVLAVGFLLPYALLFAETGAAFPQEGGPYVRVDVAFGRLPAALTTMFYWVTNPVWLGGSPAFLAAGAWNGFVFPLGSGTVADYAFKLVFIWAAILTAVVSLRRGKWITTAGAAAKVLALAFFTATAVAYGVRHGFRGLAEAHFAPTAAGFLTLVPVLLFATSGSRRRTRRATRCSIRSTTCRWRSGCPAPSPPPATCCRWWRSCRPRRRAGSPGSAASWTPPNWSSGSTGAGAGRC